MKLFSVLLTIICLVSVALYSPNAFAQSSDFKLIGEIKNVQYVQINHLGAGIVVRETAYNIFFKKDGEIQLLTLRCYTSDKEWEIGATYFEKSEESNPVRIIDSAQEEARVELWKSSNGRHRIKIYFNFATQWK
jgi:hypothetical protein